MSKRSISYIIRLHIFKNTLPLLNIDILVYTIQLGTKTKINPVNCLVHLTLRAQCMCCIFLNFCK